MDLKKLTNENLIFLNQNLTTKKEVLNFLINKLYLENKISSREKFYNAVLERESLSETGMDQGIAIPHGKTDVAKEACFAVVTVKNPIKDWESVVPTNQVTTIFLLAIPKSEEGSTHIDLLARLMTKVSDESYLNLLKNSKTSRDFYNNLEIDDEKNKISNEIKYTKQIVAVTACPAGIAHTYMAAEALIKAGDQLGVKVYVEKQGANGVEDRHTESQLKSADAAIFATEVAVKESERYSHLSIYQTKVSAPIKDGKGVITNALKKAEGHVKGTYESKSDSNQSNESLGSDIKKSVLTGISYIIPIIVAGGMINAFAVLFAQGFGLQDLYNLENSWLWLFRKMGGNLLGMIMIPALSAYMAYSLGDKTALAPGFAAGIAANLINGGFLCGMLGGLIAGYSIRFLRKYVPAKGTLAGFISFWVYPVFSSLIIGIMMFFLIGKPVAWLNQSLIDFLGSMSGSNKLLLGAILGVMVSFDLGGPINKSAYAFCVGAMAEGIIMPYAVFASVKMVSAFAVTFATLGFKKYFTKDESEIGASTWILGLAGITEGAIPFMMADPIRVIGSLCVGSAITGAIVANFNIGLDVPGAGIFSILLLKDGISPFVNGLIWFFAAVLGALISGALLVYTRKIKLEKLQVSNEK